MNKRDSVKIGVKWRAVEETTSCQIRNAGLDWKRVQSGQAIYTNDIINVFEELAEGQKKGRPVEVREGYLKALVGRHAIYFQVRSDVIAIIRILHQSMDVERHL